MPHATEEHSRAQLTAGSTGISLCIEREREWQRVHQRCRAAHVFDGAGSVVQRVAEEVPEPETAQPNR